MLIDYIVVTVISASCSAAGQVPSSTKIGRTVTFLSETSPTTSPPQQNERSTEIGRVLVHSRLTQLPAVNPKYSDKSALEPPQGNKEVQVNGKIKALLQYHADKSLEYRRKELNFITLQSPRTYIAFQNKAIYDITIHLHRSEDKHQTGFRVGRTQFLLVEIILVCLTGVLHAAVWKNKFPTDVEQLLWRTSILTMCAYSLAMLFIYNLTGCEKDLIAVLWRFHTTSPGCGEMFGCVFGELDKVSRKHANGSAHTVVNKEVKEANEEREDEEDEKKGEEEVDIRVRSYVFHQCVIWLAFCITLFCFLSHRGGVLFKLTGSAHGNLYDPRMDRLLATCVTGSKIHGI